MIEPHGGHLVDRVVGDTRERTLRDSVESATSIRLSRCQYQELENIATGRFSPLTGFMTQADFLKVINDTALEDGTTWPLPITLGVDSDKAGELQPFEKAGLETPAGDLIGVIDVRDVYKYNAEATAEKLFGTADDSHPGVEDYYDGGTFFVGGPVEVFRTERHGRNDLRPAESRVLFEHYGWDTVVGFQTRNAPHRGHEYIQKAALEHVDGLLIQPKLGYKKGGDYRDPVIVDAYDSLIKHYYPNDRVVLSTFPSKMRYAGPREAVFDAIVRKNHGCTHFVVGRDHAGVGDYYDTFEAQQIFDQIDDIGIRILNYGSAFYCNRCDGMTTDGLCCHDEDERIPPSGSEIRSLIQQGQDPPPEMMRPEVARTIVGHDQPFIRTAEGERR